MTRKQNNKIKLVLAWHMHQPHYRDGLDGQYRLPWVYLHAIKDYSDMVAHLERNPKARLVVNFAPVLLEQLDDYAKQIKAWLESGQKMQDPLLNLVAGAESIPLGRNDKVTLIGDCLKAFAPTMIDPYPRFQQLIELARSCDFERGHAKLDYLSDQFYIDLLVWYHLAWVGESIKKTDDRVIQLIEKAHDFDPSHRHLLLQVMFEVIESIIPRYRALLEAGQIELSMTPYGHPIVPLLIDFNSMRDAQPYDPAPSAESYPDGYERAKWHMQQGIKVFEDHFGQKPKGVWLSEGALSPAAIGLLDHFGIQWSASGEGVWRHSCQASETHCRALESANQPCHANYPRQALYQPIQHATQSCRLFFRDDGLSDLIGFQYKDWNPQDAANNFAHHLCNIAESLPEGEQGEYVVSVILDGENAWEYYPNNAYHFLDAFYTTLSAHDRIEMTTFSDALADGLKELHLPVLKSGSWVYGSFSTWIGSQDKNAGWDLLVEAKQTFDQVMAKKTLSAEAEQAALAQLAICEGSDWFWWFGDYNPSGSVQDFDQLYRRHLKRLYEILQVTIPDSLDTPLSQGGGEMANGGVMQRGVN